MTQPRRSVTIRDVAKAAGVSVTTVSDSLNNKGRVDASTREHVIRVADRLGYRANRSAQALRSGRSSTLGLVLPGSSDGPRDNELLALDYNVELAVAAARAAFERDHAVLLLPPLRELDDIRRFTIDGAIVVDPPAGDLSMRLLEALGVPAVTIDRDLSRPESPWWVAGDNAQNTRHLLDHLLAGGARRIALLSGDRPWGWFQECEDAYARHMDQHDCEPLVARVSLSALDRSARDASGALLDRSDPPDAILALPDGSAVGALTAARERGIDVPGELMIAAGVDSRFVQLAEPAITAMDLMPAAVGAAAVDVLLQRIGDDATGVPRIVPAELRSRASTARAASG